MIHHSPQSLDQRNDLSLTMIPWPKKWLITHHDSLTKEMTYHSPWFPDQRNYAPLTMIPWPKKLCITHHDSLTRQVLVDQNMVGPVPLKGAKVRDLLGVGWKPLKATIGQHDVSATSRPSWNSLMLQRFDVAEILLQPFSNTILQQQYNNHRTS